MVGWHHQLSGHEFEQTPGDRAGQGGRACCSPWCHKEPDTTDRLNNNNVGKTNMLGPSKFSVDSDSCDSPGNPSQKIQQLAAAWS